MIIMNTISIFPPIRDIDKLNMELSKKCVNDELFSTHFFTLHIKQPDAIDVLYRRMYEERYLRFDRKNLSKFNNEMGFYVLNITVNEAIYFVNKVTPPLMKSRYNNSQTDSIETILDLLKHFLMESNGQVEYYHSEFKKATGFNYFETSNSYDINRMTLLRKYSPSAPLIDMMVCDDFNELYNENPEILNKEIDIHVMFNFIKKNGLQELVDIINSCENENVNKFYILNIFKTDFEGYFVDVYINNYKFNKAPDVQKIFTAAYKFFIK